MSLIPSQRHLFDIPDDVAYFNRAYYSPQLIDSQNRLLAGRAATVVSELKKRSIYVSQRGDSIRFAPHLHVSDYAVMPLEGLWWADDTSAFVAGDRSGWKWTMMPHPPFVRSAAGRGGGPWSRRRERRNPWPI